MVGSGVGYVSQVSPVPLGVGWECSLSMEMCSAEWGWGEVTPVLGVSGHSCSREYLIPEAALGFPATQERRVGCLWCGKRVPGCWREGALVGVPD